MGVPAEKAQIVLDALDVICPRMALSTGELAQAAALAERHGLTVYDAAYAAAAQTRHAELVTLDRALLAAGLGLRPSQILTSLQFAG